MLCRQSRRSSIGVLRCRSETRFKPEHFHMPSQLAERSPASAARPAANLLPDRHRPTAPNRRLPASPHPPRFEGTSEHHLCLEAATSSAKMVMSRIYSNTEKVRRWFLIDWPSRVLGIAFIGLGLLFVAQGMEQSIAPIAMTPEEMHRMGQGVLSAPGMQQVNLVGDPAKPGPYTLRLKFPKGLRIAPHTHPDSRELTVLSGLLAAGYGEKFDADHLKLLPAGSFFTQPKHVPHYMEIKEDTVLQISGMGPSQRIFVVPMDTTSDRD